MHNKNNPTLIKANFIKTANFLEDLVGDIFNNCLFGKISLDVKNKSKFALNLFCQKDEIKSFGHFLGALLFRLNILLAETYCYN